MSGGWPPIGSETRPDRGCRVVWFLVGLTVGVGIMCVFVGSGLWDAVRRWL